MKTEIITYYDNLAKNYDSDRFSNSYGKYIHQQELRILKNYLSKHDTNSNLDLACGTGRFLDFAQHGIDISQNMIEVSRKKFPHKTISKADAENLPFKNSLFKNIISLHLLMHLNTNALIKIQKEVARVCTKEGLYIFDIPSEKRRRLFRFKKTSWHGGYQTTYKNLNNIVKDHWEIVNFHGIAFFPIHRIPKKLRKLFIGLDTMLCNSIFKEYSSHLIFILKKK